MRTGNIWRWFMQNREIPLALDKLGIKRYATKASLEHTRANHGSDSALNHSKSSVTIRQRFQ